MWRAATCGASRCPRLLLATGTLSHVVREEVSRCYSTQPARGYPCAPFGPSCAVSCAVPCLVPGSRVHHRVAPDLGLPHPGMEESELSDSADDGKSTDKEGSGRRVGRGASSAGSRATHPGDAAIAAAGRPAPLAREQSYQEVEDGVETLSQWLSKLMIARGSTLAETLIRFVKEERDLSVRAAALAVPPFTRTADIRCVDRLLVLR